MLLFYVSGLALVAAHLQPSRGTPMSRRTLFEKRCCRGHRTVYPRRRRGQIVRFSVFDKRCQIYNRSEVVFLCSGGVVLRSEGVALRSEGAFLHIVE